MYVNAQKSKTMVVTRQDNISVQVDHEEESLEQVHDFKFLGSYKSAVSWLTSYGKWHTYEKKKTGVNAIGVRMEVL